ncbi:hypothetical protein GOP47_0017906 [Adiantum capillus-veneris]|uniref:Uncharacterized protein n=1 Tax=Adiantum capillus-veneris TaxID=13818 RepID=A0A9D4UG94_ADICA|nr:hypothetical protein GOP47_0017906 [Adiantum capillus-veneris]
MSFLQAATRVCEHVSPLSRYFLCCRQIFSSFSVFGWEDDDCCMSPPSPILPKPRGLTFFLISGGFCRMRMNYTDLFCNLCDD